MMRVWNVCVFGCVRRCGAKYLIIIICLFFETHPATEYNGFCPAAQMDACNELFVNLVIDVLCWIYSIQQSITHNLSFTKTLSFNTLKWKLAFNPIARCVFPCHNEKNHFKLKLYGWCSSHINSTQWKKLQQTNQKMQRKQLLFSIPGKRDEPGHSVNLSFCNKHIPIQISSPPSPTSMRK